MLGRTVAGTVATLLLTGGGSVAENRQSPPRATAGGTVQAQADWVRAVVRRAGYETVSGTGSALVASTGATRFYIWTTAGSAEKVPDDVGPPLGTVAGTPVYGDGEPWTVDDDGLPTAAGWRIWSAQGFIFWTTAGPSAADIPLSFTALEPLIEASKAIPPPLG
jgi:hypothetical protein